MNEKTKALNNQKNAIAANMHAHKWGTNSYGAIKCHTCDLKGKKAHETYLKEQGGDMQQVHPSLTEPNQ